MSPKSIWYLFLGIALVGIALVLGIGYFGSTPRVALYCAQDRPFAESILGEFHQRTGIEVSPKFDSEANKSVGLYASIVQERERPRCDVFWNNEILSMIRLERAGLLVPYESPAAKDLTPFPKSARSPSHSWHAFATRARILIVNTRLLPKKDWPTSLLDLTKPRYRGQCVMAKPTHGTSATHAACLFEVMGSESAKSFYRELKANDIQIAPGNKDVAVWVGRGEAPDGKPAVVGLTDTDDAMAEVRAGRQVALRYPDREGATDNPRWGTLYIPNTVGIVANAPNSTKSRRLVDYLLSAEIEKRLAKSASCQIPFRADLRAVLPPQIEVPPHVKAMNVDFYRAADLWDEVQTFVRNEFAKAK